MEVGDYLGQIQELTLELRESKEIEIRTYLNRCAEDNYHSNSIEGSTVTLDETKQILNGMSEYVYKPGIFKSEVLDYADAQEHMISHYRSDGALDLDFILKLHSILLKRSKPHYAGLLREQGQDAFAGFFDVGYARGARVREEMLTLMQEWDKLKFDNIISTLWNAIWFKYRFLRIHPFGDGNGRMSRLILNFILLSNRMFPLFITVPDKENYMHAIRQAQKNDNVRVYFDALIKIYFRGCPKSPFRCLSG